MSLKNVEKRPILVFSSVSILKLLEQYQKPHFLLLAATIMSSLSLEEFLGTKC